MAEPFPSPAATPGEPSPTVSSPAEAPLPAAPVTTGEPDWPKIYLLPNLMTAGNLFCGFAAALKMVEAASLMHPMMTDMSGNKILLNPDITDAAVVAKIYAAIALILASCVFDLLDGRLARLGGTDSPFGREFDSLADIVSFGIAPALMVYTVVLHEFTRTGWLIASIYLICGALRLARFNCLAAQNSTAANKEFTGFPIPAAAGLIASLTLFLLWLYEKQNEMRTVAKWILPPLMIFLAWMMFSKFRYPSFKGIGWRTKRSLPRFLFILLAVILTAVCWEWMPFVIFLVYLLYGFLRPFLSRSMKREIEEEDDEGEGSTERRA
jgi:CDP-diacylglycerol--serine O-phosphatidyltransferase